MFTVSISVRSVCLSLNHDCNVFLDVFYSSCLLFNIDPLHDLAESGVVPVVVKFVLECFVNHRGIPAQTIVARFRQFNFHEGRPGISYVSKVSTQEVEFAFDFKGIQVSCAHVPICENWLLIFQNLDVGIGDQA